MAKYKYIKDWGNHELLALQCICKSGSASYDDLLELGFKPRRISDFCTDKIFKKVKETVETDDGPVTRTRIDLGTAGKTEAKKRGYTFAFQKAQSINHDSKAFSTVKGLIESGVKVNNILNESEQKKTFSRAINKAKSQGKKFSVCDLVVKEPEAEVIRVIEIATENYDKTEIKEHREYAEAIGGSFELVKTYEEE